MKHPQILYHTIPACGEDDYRFCLGVLYSDGSTLYIVYTNHKEGNELAIVPLI